MSSSTSVVVQATAVLGSFENSYIPENPRTPPISYISQTVISFKKPTSEPSKTGFETKQKTVHICTKKSLHICKVFGKKKVVFWKKNFATGHIFERFLAPRSRFFEKMLFQMRTIIEIENRGTNMDRTRIEMCACFERDRQRRVRRSVCGWRLWHVISEVYFPVIAANNSVNDAMVEVRGLWQRWRWMVAALEMDGGSTSVEMDGESGGDE
ncbi:hypothetical protein LXL04_016577 [Taraxacum kok-saghyz]